MMMPGSVFEYGEQLMIARRIRDIVRGLTGAYLLERRLGEVAEAVRGLHPPADLGVGQARVTGAGPDPAAIYPLSNWWEPSFWEPTVALAIRDHCRPGNVVFDVGTNAGGMALMMSRLVGPRGIVLAFEASPRIIDKTHFNLVKAGCHNVTLFHKAVWHTTGSIVNIAAGSHLNDRIEEGATGMSVRTVALDDLAGAGDFRPSFIKMDIEGAEFDALRGMTRLLADVRPVLVLEQSPEDMRCHALLTAANYFAVDLATYLPVTSAADFLPGTSIANLLFAPCEAVATNAYFVRAAPELVANLPADDFVLADNGDISLRTPLSLPAGRYIVRGEFSAEGTDNEILAGVEVDGVVTFRYHTFTAFMAASYRNWVIHLERPSRVGPYMRFLRGSDPSLLWRGVTISHLPAFANLSPPVLE
jgi:FkbM family methyltransferase